MCTNRPKAACELNSHKRCTAVVGRLSGSAVPASTTSNDDALGASNRTSRGVPRSPTSDGADTANAQACIDLDDADGRTESGNSNREFPIVDRELDDRVAALDRNRSNDAFELDPLIRQAAGGQPRDGCALGSRQRRPRTDVDGIRPDGGRKSSIPCDAAHVDRVTRLQAVRRRPSGDENAGRAVVEKQQKCPEAVGKAPPFFLVVLGSEEENGRGLHIRWSPRSRPFGDLWRGGGYPPDVAQRRPAA